MDTKPEIIAQLEAVLFASGAPQHIDRIAKTLRIPKDEAFSAIDALEVRYRASESGLTLMRLGDAVQIATKGKYASVIERLRTGEIEENLSRASLETLAVIAYRARVTRADIDAIRGVNSSFTLRHLLIRGLIEREGNPHDSRGYIYRPTFDFLKVLGIERVTDLPEYDALSSDERLINLLSENAPTGDVHV